MPTPPVHLSQKAATSPRTPTAARLVLHGDARVVLPDGRNIALERRAAALCALAALDPGASRERAARWLWPDSDDPRRNLRQQLLRFRHALDTALVAEGNALALACGVQLAAADPNAPLLGALDFSDCPEFAQWLETQRDTDRAARIAESRERIASAESSGDLDAAASAAQALVNDDPDSEAHHRELMRLHYLRGDTVAGLAAYRRLSEQLAHEHGTRPSAASEQLAQVLRANAQQSVGTNMFVGAVVSRQALPVTLKRPPLLAGRDRERAAVLQHWADGHAVLLEGEAGLGKSRLMAELLSGQGSTLCAAGRPGDAGAPYATLARLLRPLLEDGGVRLDTNLRDTLAHIAPGLAPPAASARPALRPGQMAAAVSALLQQRGVPTVALDDVHFADDATVELIAGLVAPTDPPRRWLLAARPAELSSAAQTLRTSLSELLRLGVVTLAALDEDAIAALVDGLAIHGLQGSTLAAPLWRHTGGNPMFVLETLKHGLTDGSLARGELPRPQSVGALIERRLQRLSEPALTLARVAAIAGVDFSIELAESAIGVRAVQLASSWSELQDAQVLRDESFAHDLVCDAVLRSVPPVVARRVHAQCAAWIEARGGEPARVATHWQHAGAPSEAARAYLQAAERALKASRHAEEAWHLGQAAAQFQAAGMQDEQFGALASQLDALVLVSGDDEVLAQAATLREQARTDLQQVRAARAEVDLLTNLGHFERALAIGEPALEQARRIDASAEQLALAMPMVHCLDMLSRTVEALPLLEPLQGWVDREASPEQRAQFIVKRAQFIQQQGRLGEALVLKQQALEIRRTHCPASQVAATLQHISIIHVEMGRMPLAEAASREAVQLLPRELGIEMQHLLQRMTHARQRTELGEFGPALVDLEEVLAELKASDLAFWPEATELALAHLWLRLGQVARAQRLLAQDLADSPPRLRAVRRLLRLELAMLMEQMPSETDAGEACVLAPGDFGPGLSAQVAALRALAPERALSQATHLVEVASSKQRMGLALTACAWRAQAAAQLSRKSDVRSALRHAQALLDDGIWPDTIARTELQALLWRAALAAGETEHARRALADGVAWLRHKALPHVPPEFLDAFLHRHPVNRALLAAASKL